MCCLQPTAATRRFIDAPAGDGPRSIFPPSRDFTRPQRAGHCRFLCGGLRQRAHHLARREDGIHKELLETGRQAWSTDDVSWKDDDTVVVEFTPTGRTTARTLERRLTDPNGSVGAPAPRR